MIEGRFSDREFLSSYDLDISLLENYNINIIDLIPLKKNYIIETNEGKKLLKKLDFEIERLNFINNGMEALTYNGFDKFSRYNKNSSENIYTPWKNNIYGLKDYLEGEECICADKEKIELVVDSVMKMYEASKDFSLKYQGEYTDLGRLIGQQQTNMNKLKCFRELLKGYKYKTEFQILMEEVMDEFINKLQLGIDLLMGSSYFKLCKDSNCIGLIFNNLQNQSIILSNNDIYFSDLDDVLVGLSVQDLYGLMRRVEKLDVNDDGLSKYVFEVWDKKTNISEEEVEVLKALLTIPQDFINLTIDYFERRRIFVDNLELIELQKIIQWNSKSYL